jgi:TfoX/Sxy family transcriptional regulator of competence genes
MAWIKIPAENHTLYLGALPRDPRASTVRMFGGLCTMVNEMACGLFARSVFVNVDAAGQQEALSLDGAEPFDPMGKGHALSGKVMLPETIMDEPAELRDWLRRAVEYTATLPPKKKAAARRSASPKAATTRSAPRPKAAKASAARSKAAGSGRAARARAKPARASRR